MYATELIKIYLCYLYVSVEIMILVFRRVVEKYYKSVEKGVDSVEK